MSFCIKPLAQSSLSLYFSLCISLSVSLCFFLSLSQVTIIWFSEVPHLSQRYEITRVRHE